MVLKADQERVKTLLKDTITLLCKNGLSFKSKFCVEALIGVTLDESDVFIVSINELVKSEKAAAEEAAAASDSSEDYPKKAPSQNQKARNRDPKHRRSKSPIERHPKRIKVANSPVIKHEFDSSDAEDEEEEMRRIDAENMRRMGQMPQGMMLNPGHGHEHLWDDDGEEEDEPDSMSESFEDSNSPFSHELAHNRMQHMQQQLHHQQQHSKLQHQLQQQRRHQQQHQQKQQQMKPESSQDAQKGMSQGEETGEIMFIKEEPDEEDDMWPPGEEDPEDDGSMHPDSMYQSMVNPAAADTSGLPEDHNFSSLSEMDLVPVGPQEVNAMWNQPSQSMSSQSRAYRPRTQPNSRSSKVSSASDSNPQSGSMAHNAPDTQQNAEDQCVFTVYEDEMMPSPSKAHLQTTMYFCQICGRSFGSLKMYNTHKDEHKGIFKFNCEECNSGFSTKLKYEAHVRRHTGERFACTVCGKDFISKAGLSRHTKTQHNNK